MTALRFLAAWCALSVPVALIAGRLLRGGVVKTCSADGCMRTSKAKGLCNPCYQRSRYQARHAPVAHSCPMCGEYVHPIGRDAFTNDGESICPICDMTPGEHAYRLRILADSAAVYAEEHRAYQAQRAAARSAVA